MKVIHLYSGNRFGGVERILIKLVNQRQFTSELEQEFIIVFKDKLSEALEHEGAKVKTLFPVSFSRPWTIIKAWISIYALLRKSDPNVLICHDIWSFILGHLPARLCRLKVVLWAHTGGLNYSLYKYLDIFNPDHVIACSHYLKSELQDRFQKLKITTLYAPIEIPEKAKNHNFKNNIFQILFAGRLVPLKGADLLIRSIPLIKSDDILLTLLAIVTNYEEELFLAKLNKLIQDLKLESKVEIIVNPKNIESYFESSDLYCQPNRYAETFGLSFIEALSYGLPVITNAVGGAKEIIQGNDMTYGTFINPEKLETISNAILDWKANDQKRMEFSSKARNRAIELCSAKIVMTQFNQILKSINSD